jgi:galactokinase
LSDRPIGFSERFGHEPSVRAEAPGRVNLIGEHTDYNAGLVLPMAIPQHTTVELAERPDRQVVVHSDGMDPPTATYKLGHETRTGTWVDFVQGVTKVIREQHELPGFSALIRSDVPVGSGLSSSAALEISLLRGLRELARLPIDDLTLAKLGRRVEVEFVGVPVGLMDQMASSFADRTHALLIDFRTLRTERIALPPTLGVAVIDSGQRHDNASSEYAVRRRECEDAARRLGVEWLSDLGQEDLGRIAALPEPLNRRARHVVTENARVVVAAEALRQGDLQAFGQLLDASHASMRDDYQCTTMAIDELVALARAMDGVVGARMTGGGFGGSIVVCTHAGREAAVGRAVVEQGRSISELHPALLVP